VESAPFFIPSSSFCSLSLWFTSSYAYHLITVPIFALTICHSIDLLLKLKLISSVGEEGEFGDEVEVLLLREI